LILCKLFSDFRSLVLFIQRVIDQIRPTAKPKSKRQPIPKQNSAATPRTNTNVSLANIPESILASFPATTSQALLTWKERKKAASINTKLTKTAFLNILDSSGAGQGIPPEDL